MRYDNIEIGKSKSKGRLIRKTWIIEPLFDCLIYLALICFMPLSSGFYWMGQFKNNESLFLVTILFLMSLIISGFLFYAIITINRLTRVNGLVKDQNRDLVKEVIEKLGWSIQYHNQQLTIASPKWSIFSANWGRQVVILYDKQDLLINCTTYGLHDIKSPFHWFGSRKNEQIFIEQFEQKIKQQTANNGS